MRIRLGLAAVLAACIGLASGSAVANTIYNLDLHGGGASAVGTITTDSTIGVLQEANFIDWQITLKSGSGTSSMHGAPFSQVILLGTSVTATATGLSFDFGSTDGAALLFLVHHLGGGPIGDGLCFNDASGLCSGNPSQVLVGIEYVSDTAFSIGSGVQQFASVAPTPLPAALPLLISAIGGMGFVGWRCKRPA